MSQRKESLLAPSRLREQLGVGAIVAALATVAEAITIACRSSTDPPAPGELVLAIAHLGAMMLPIGLALGLGMGVALASLDAAPFSAPVLERFASRRRLFRRDPIAFRVGAGALAGMLALFAVLPRLAKHFATSYHDADLAAWAMTGAVTATVLGGVVVAAVVTRASAPLATALGRLASAGTAVLLALAGACGGLLAAYATIPQLFEAYDPVSLAWAPGIALSWLATTALVRRRARRHTTGKRPLGIALVVAIGVVGLLVSGATYGRRNRVRALVEQRSVAGLVLVRLWAGATNRDRDGHSYAFGGGDCDDSRAWVYPGARDVPGDGVDADCFDGDGSRDVANLSDGDYGSVPSQLHRPNLLLVTVDALRASHLGCYGYERPTSPTIDALAAESVRFESRDDAVDALAEELLGALHGLLSVADRFRPGADVPHAARRQRHDRGDPLEGGLRDRRGHRQ